MKNLEDIYITSRKIANETYKLICQKQKIRESLKQIHADFGELESLPTVGMEEQKSQGYVYAHMNNEKLA